MTLGQFGMLVLCALALVVILVPGDWLERRLKR